MLTPTPSGYSAQVRIELRAGSEIFSPAQVGGGRLFFDCPVILPGSSGELLVRIDEHECRWAVTWEPSRSPRKIIHATYTEMK